MFSPDNDLVSTRSNVAEVDNHKYLRLEEKLILAMNSKTDWERKVLLSYDE